MKRISIGPKHEMIVQPAVEFIKNTAAYEFDCPAGVFYEEHIFSERWFQNGGVPDGFRMWAPVVRT